MSKTILTFLICVTSTLASAASITTNELEVFTDSGSKIYLRGADARELHDFLPTQPRLDYACLRYETRPVGPQGDSDVCVEYSTEVIRSTKELGSLFCIRDVRAGTDLCRSELYRPFSKTLRPFPGDSNEIGRILRGRRFQTSSGVFGFSCQELVAGRYYDCFYTVDFESPSLTTKLIFTAGSGQFQFEGPSLKSGYLFVSQFHTDETSVQRLRETLVPAAPGQRRVLEGTPYSVVLQDVEGTLRVREGSEQGYRMVVDLSPAFLAHLKDSVTDPSVFRSGVTIFDRAIPYSLNMTVRIKLSDDLTTGTLEIVKR